MNKFCKSRHDNYQLDAAKMEEPAFGKRFSLSVISAAILLSFSPLSNGASYAAGPNASAKPFESVAVGVDVQAEQANSIVIGNDSLATGIGAMVIGSDDDSGWDTSVENPPDNPTDYPKKGYYPDELLNFGYLPDTYKGDAKNTVEPGRFRKAAALGRGATVYGARSQALTDHSMAYGDGATAGQAKDASGISKSKSAKDYKGVGAAAIGSFSRAKEDNSVALGTRSMADRAALDSTSLKTSDSKIDALSNNVYSADSAGDTDIKATVKGSYGAVSIGTEKATRQIINVAAGSLDTDAVNVAQLRAVANMAKKAGSTAAANTGWTVTDADGHDALIKPNGKVTFESTNGNIAVAQTGADNDGKVQFTLSKKLTGLESVQTNTVELGDKGPKLTNDSGNISVSNNAGDNAKIKGIADGDLNDKSSDAVNGSQLANILGIDAAGNAITQNIGDTGEDSIDDAIRFVNQRAAAAKTTISSPNNSIAVDSTQGPGGTAYTISLNKNIQADSLTIPSSVAGSHVEVAADGLNNGGNPIKGVAAGHVALGSNEAVNGDQLYHVQQQVGDLDKRSRAGIASAMASAGLPQAYLPGKSMVAVAAGHYRGQTALAVGASAISDNGKWVIKGTANVNQKDPGATIGVGYQW